jgi:hypothetical protein
MHYHKLIGAIALAAAMMTMGGAQAADDAKYPDWKGQWSRINTNQEGQSIKFDPTKPTGPGQQAPLTPEYQKVLEDSMAEQAIGGLGNYPSARCILGGMPRTMATILQEYIITPETTYIVGGPDILDIRRIYTDGRDWPKEGEVNPTYLGYQSADGSTRTATAATTCLRSTPAGRSRDLVLTTIPGCLCTSTISRPSRKEFISTRPIRTFFMTKSRYSTTL